LDRLEVSKHEVKGLADRASAVQQPRQVGHVRPAWARLHATMRHATMRHAFPYLTVLVWYEVPQLRQLGLRCEFAAACCTLHAARTKVDAVERAMSMFSKNSSQRRTLSRSQLVVNGA
jgi:hypothetical protein